MFVFALRERERERETLQVGGVEGETDEWEEKG